MSILEAIKKGFVGAGKLMNVILIFFVFNAIIGFVTLPLANPARAANPGILAISIVAGILFFLVFIFIQGGALGLVRDQIKTSVSGMSNFISYGKRYYLRILGLLCLYVLIAVSIVLLLGLLSAGILLLGDNIITRSVVAIIVTVAALVLITLLLYPIYSLVAEDTGALEAFRRGVIAAKSNFWKTLALFLSILAISLIISFIMGAIVGMISVLLPANITQIVITIINALVQAYIPIVMMLSFMSFYLSLSKASVQE